MYHKVHLSPGHNEFKDEERHFSTARHINLFDKRFLQCLLKSAEAIPNKPLLKRAMCDPAGNKISVCKTINTGATLSFIVGYRPFKRKIAWRQGETHRRDFQDTSRFCS
ncbi:hypothetical protein PoB_005614500 [Plakobranchus ocellatus]|uniref:Uncharacterized protein n=1 Tax=Plakobranchus ocellatus TaxID=259542 RepID=A0AAV4CDY2_9GAST|nr:hypothetical protein PoB_005614500 [Plakobranchus ocellatus]